MELNRANLEIKEQRRTVGFDSYDITVKQLVDMVAEGQINIAPEYQRHFVWDEVRQSQLIESIFLGIPIPSLFMATNEDSSWEVIDGLQRITTLLNFVFPELSGDQDNLELSQLKLRGLEKVKSLNLASFTDLTSQLKLNFMTRPIRVTVLNDRSDHQVRFDLFERLNTGGIVLHEQEIRNCVFQGRFNDFIKLCASDSRLVQLVRRTDTKGRGNLEELVLKFFAYFERREKFTHSVKEFLNEYMESKTKSFSNEIELRELFNSTMQTMIDAIPNGVTRKDRPNTTPLLLFEAVTVGVADAISKGNPVNSEALRLVLDNNELKKLTSGGTNSYPKLVGRIDLVREAVSAQ